eukprot:CAMPEP_0171092834 /NCGR_PEP_ID=MMETSP0766_2-20121228/37618_1 /TAXON_ID=439317 /ORGANISM="Gambierdiscus australes, Strain CAWD 149" /LENGTH=195 /DNA_ID=CAMNT_0011551147 /DNA_START=66 /DNA_END=651 /DNA_ORIENTATION=-
MRRSHKTGALTRDARLLALLSLLHHGVLLGDVVEHSALARLLQLARDEDLVEDVVGLVEVEDEIELTDVAEVAVQALHKMVHDLQGQKLVVSVVDACNEEQACVSLVAELVVAPLKEVAHLGRAAQDEAAHLLDGPELVTLKAWNEPLFQPRLPLPADQQNELDHRIEALACRPREWSVGKGKGCARPPDPLELE